MALYCGLLPVIGLSFESFMVSMANGLHNASNGVKRGVSLALLFASCHAAALMLGYLLITLVASGIHKIDGVLTWISFAVLAALGIKMIAEGINLARGKCEKLARTTTEFIVQSVVASFDAFAVGLTVPDFSVWSALFTAGVMFSAIMLFYTIGFSVGQRFGTKLGKYSAVLGGLVFVGLAVEIII